LFVVAGSNRYTGDFNRNRTTRSWGCAEKLRRSKSLSDFENLIRDNRETPSKRDASKSNTDNLSITSAVGERLEAADCQKDIYIFQFTAGNFAINATIADSFPN
jgi:hypothetical protein